MVSMNNLTIRSATAADTAALATLAALDSREIPAAPQLIADRRRPADRRRLARDGSAIADPFVRSADAVEILRRRARQLDGRSPGAAAAASPCAPSRTKTVPRAQSRIRRRCSPRSGKTPADGGMRS